VVECQLPKMAFDCKQRT